jgi:hypothetical protein
MSAASQQPVLGVPVGSPVPANGQPIPRGVAIGIPVGSVAVPAQQSQAQQALQHPGHQVLVIQDADVSGLVVGPTCHVESLQVTTISCLITCSVRKATQQAHQSRVSSFLYLHHQHHQNSRLQGATGSSIRPCMHHQQLGCIQNNTTFVASSLSCSLA